MKDLNFCFHAIISTSFVAVLILIIFPFVDCNAQQGIVRKGLPRARPEEVGLSAAALQRITPALQAYVDSGRLAGIVAVVARHGKIAYLDSVGFMDIELRQPMRTDAVFRIYSMTKPVTAVAVMQLFERGKLRLDDPVSKYIPAFAQVQVYSGGYAAKPTLRNPDKPISIEHLLTHTAGLTYGIGNSPVDSIYRGASLLRANQTIEEFADTIARLPLLFSPGTAWNYSVAMDVLGRVVEVVSGKTFDRYLEDEIFEPLGMDETAFHATLAMAGRITTLYSRGLDGKLSPRRPLLRAVNGAEGKLFGGGGGLLSSVSDYLRFTQMLLNGGELDGHRVLNRETVALMMHNHIPLSLIPIKPPVPNWPPGRNGYGYGGAVCVDSADAGPESQGIYRWAGAGATFFWIDSKEDLVAMVWAQFSGSEVWSIDNEFERLVHAAVSGQ
jgi:CubicO group peptidase (beta-lactamase class C family)